MAVTKGNTTGSISNIDTLSTSRIFSHDNNGEDVILAITTAGTGTITATYNGVSMDFVVQGAGHAGARVITIFKLADASAGANDVAITHPNTFTSQVAAIAVSILGAGDDIFTNYSINQLVTPATSIADSLVTDDSGEILGFLSCATISTITSTGDQTKYTEYASTISGRSAIAASYNTGVSGTTNHSWTYSASDEAAMTIIELQVGLVPPTVTTQAVTAIKHNSATFNGNITDVGVGNATIRGFYYKVGSTGDPTSGDSVLSESGDFSAGAYALGATGLLPETSYRVASFATNADGTSTGSTVGFTTTETPESAGGSAIGALQLGISSL